MNEHDLRRYESTMKRKPTTPRGPGRPATPALDRKVSRTVTLPASQWSALEKAAHRSNTTLSAYISQHVNIITK